MVKIIHYHIQTVHKNGTPEYPSREAAYIYRTGCAKELDSTYQDEYVITSVIDRVTCRPCLVWAKAYERQNSLVNRNYIYNRHIKVKGGENELQR